MIWFLIISLNILLLPFWLQPMFIRLRMWIFTAMNGKQSIQMPSTFYNTNDFLTIYSHPSVNGRSQGAKLSDLFWYWLSPGAYMHQEHLEAGEKYDQLAQFTRSILSVSKTSIDSILEACFKQLSNNLAFNQYRFIKVRDCMIPFWSDFFYQIVFDEPCSSLAKQLISAHANDVITALKCTGMRHMKKRYALTKFLMKKLKYDPLSKAFPKGYSLRQKAFFLQGTFFNTAVVQMSEAIAHLVMTLAEHQDIQSQLEKNPQDRELYNHVIHENLRLYPLFGIAHRITQADIRLSTQIIPKGSVVCFNYDAYHKLNFQSPNQFKPERWNSCPIKQSGHIPFGVPENRSCPAQGLALISMRKLTQMLLSKYYFTTSAKHTRSLPNRAPVLITSRKTPVLTRSSRIALLLVLKIRDLFENLFISFKQLIFGIIMIIDARRLKLCQNYFSQETK